ncbi:hypothetical protein ACLBYD_26285 [Rhodococcus sp. C26F]
MFPAAAAGRRSAFVLLAEALVCTALRCDHEDALEATIARARAVTDQPVVIDLIVDDTALVWSMVAAGASNNHLTLADGIRPLFDESDQRTRSIPASSNVAGRRLRHPLRARRARRDHR